MNKTLVVILALLVAAFARGGEVFVPARLAGMTLEVCPEATITGTEVRLRQIVRVADKQSGEFAPIADLIVARIAGKEPFVGLSIRDLRGTLEDAGVNVAAIRFVGAGSITVHRSDIEVDSRTAMQKWIDAREKSLAGGTGPTTAPTPVEATAPKNAKTLRQLLVSDLAARLDLPADSLQVTFKPADERTLMLSDSTYKFDIAPSRNRRLGPVDWDVALTIGTETQKLRIAGTAQAWQNQLILVRPVMFKQILKADDVTQKRELVSMLPSDPPVAAAAVLDQQAIRDLRTGTVVTAKLFEPQEVVHRGQLVTITARQGPVAVTTVAKAMENGSVGRTIKVKNETTNKQFDVQVTGPQAASVSDGLK